MLDLLIKNAHVVDGTGSPAYRADVGVQDGMIREVGNIDASAKREIDADGNLLTPGFVDIHSHFDGQVCWDKQITPSCWHGVTTVVMGNCGVGFAPVKPGTHEKLVRIMESVEDIPGSALSEGITWNWESFAEYLDAIDTPYVMDIGTQVPHVALRHYVMGDRCYGDATRDDMEQMATLTEEALKAGALGFSHRESTPALAQLRRAREYSQGGGPGPDPRPVADQGRCQHSVAHQSADGGADLQGGGNPRTSRRGLPGAEGTLADS